MFYSDTIENYLSLQRQRPCVRPPARPCSSRSTPKKKQVILTVTTKNQEISPDMSGSTPGSDRVGRIQGRSRTSAPCVPSGSTRRATSPSTSGRIQGRSRTSAPCVLSGSPRRATAPATSGHMLERTPRTQDVLACTYFISNYNKYSSDTAKGCASSLPCSKESVPLRPTQLMDQIRSSNPDPVLTGHPPRQLKVIYCKESRRGSGNHSRFCIVSVDVQVDEQSPPPTPPGRRRRRHHPTVCLWRWWMAGCTGLERPLGSCRVMTAERCCCSCGRVWHGDQR